MLIGQVNTLLQDLNAALQHQRNETELARRRADEYFALIEGTTREAAEAKTLLVRQGASHGAAQSMMMAEIESLALQYRQLAVQYRTATGQPAPRPEPRLNRSIQVVAAEFEMEYVRPAVEARAAGEVPVGVVTHG